MAKKKVERKECGVMGEKQKLCGAKPVAKIKLPWYVPFWVCAEHLRDFQRDLPTGIEYKEV